MKRCLVMITSSFPYSTGETYIESEVAFYKNRFDKVIILPIELDPDAPLTRGIPESFDAINVSKRKQRTARTNDVFGGVKNIIKPTDYYAYDRDAIGNSFKKRMFFEYFCNRSTRSFSECIEALDGFDFRIYDSITVYSYWFFATAMVGVMLKKYFSDFCDDVRLISRAHGYDVYENRNALNYLPLRRYLLENCDAVYPCSEAGTTHIVSQFPEFAYKIKTAHLATADGGMSKQSEIGFHLVSCSLAVDVKRLDRIVDILEQIEKAGEYRLKWTHIGDGNRKKEIENYARKKLRSVKFEFVGNISNPDVFKYYRNNPVDLFISTSESEGLPVSMMEAASFGIPIISTDVGGVREIVRDGYNGWLMNEFAEPEEFARIIRQFYGMDKDKREIYRKNSREIWEDSFDAEKTYTDFFAVPVVTHA